jgi:hypothetical protein
MNNDLISRAEMFKALGIEYHGPDVLLDKKILESQLANKEYDRRTDVVWEIRKAVQNK